MAKNRILKSAEPMFHWNVAPAVPFETSMRTDLGNTFYPRFQASASGPSGPAGQDVIQFPADGRMVPVDPDGDWKRAAETDYLENVRRMEEKYMGALEQGVLIPCFDTYDWDLRMMKDAAKLQSAGQSIEVGLPNGETAAWADVDARRDAMQRAGAAPDAYFSSIKAAAGDISAERERAKARQAAGDIPVPGGGMDHGDSGLSMD